MKLNSNSKVLIATFSPWKKGKRLPINGNLEPMIDFFTPKVSRTVVIDEVYPGSDFVIPRIEVYFRKKLKAIKRPSFYVYFLFPFLKIANSDNTHIAFKIRDFLTVVDWGMKSGETYDFFIGFEAINAIAGIFLRRLGKVKSVIYYVSDYSPKRYKSKWFNSLYLSLDRFAARHSDVIWDVSPAMHPARIKEGLNSLKSAPVLVVPNALYPKQINPEKVDRIIKNSLVFMGTLGYENGPDDAIKALPIVLRKNKNVALHIVGGGRDEERLMKLAKKLKLMDKVIFHGFIADREEVSNEVRKYMLALAPYKKIPGSARAYGDATKIRAYLAAGLPVITTSVPPIGQEVVKSNAGVVVDDNPQSLAGAIVEILHNKKRYAELRLGAIKFSKNNTWENEFNKAFLKMEKL